MYPFWKPIVKPLLMAADPKTLIEIGSEAGKNTINLLEYCRERNATLQAIDPSPRFDVDAWEREHVGRLTVHRGLSLEVLPRLAPADCVCVDGDHNWYTVREELRLIDERSVGAGAPLPLILLHDIGWPYARRDLYYDPATIPADYRQPYQRKGIMPGVSELMERGGHNATLCNATREGGRQNGVLTAVEDYLRESPLPRELILIPGFSGLGILFDRSRFASNSAFCALIRDLTPSPLIARYIEMLERSRIALMIRSPARGLVPAR
ncbi:class I SAM-dependent methyltransferase [Tautonia sociabilis]|uniref:Class I SAM-dependent methyltransferase n=1 Tax=Tautonia sociabilis TaxID=2080755 RepID=A0A432ML32_9BACT|nr:class I SAM-dependent methyltransferase [Tautonia sociabilis]RUL87845.1 class I SAM-dependent methyltransferase [Tautonia sociabilis]